MTIVYGQIESLKRIRKILDQKGISRFNSIREIDEFKINYEYERQGVIDRTSHNLAKEINELKSDETEIQSLFEERKRAMTEAHVNETIRLKEKYDLLAYNDYDPVFKILKHSIWRGILKLRIIVRERNANNAIIKHTHKLGRRLSRVKKQLAEYENNREKIIEMRSGPEVSQLDFVRRIIEEINPLIAGAIGENLVEKELRKLSDDYVLINDFYAEFDPPIYNRKEADKIFSLQIDHLLVSKSGVLVIETKNWSSQSLQNLDLRSPVEQIRRSNFALFVLLNSGSLSRIHLNQHHWGDKQIPVKNLIAMINHKPKDKFKYVQIKTLNELNGYIASLDPIFSNSEVTQIANYLKGFKYRS